MYGLARWGHVDILKWFISAGKLNPEQHGDMLLQCAVQGCQEGVARLLFDKKVSRVWRRFEWAVNEWSDNLKLTAKHRSAIEFLLDAEVVSLAEAVWWAAENNCLFSFGQMMRSKESRFSARYTSAWCEALMQAAHRGIDAGRCSRRTHQPGVHELRPLQALSG